MGERLANTDLLAQYGITPIPLEEGTRVFRELLHRDLPDTSVVVTGRIGNPPTLAAEAGELPFLRFLESVRVNLRGVELNTDDQVSLDSDPYVNDHVFENQRILPGVIGLEAIAQSAMALLEAEAPPIFEDVVFQRPVVVPENGPVMIRIAALLAEPGCCHVVLRSSETAFQVDHVRAVCKIRETIEDAGALGLAEKLWDSVPLDPSRDLYGSILFHSGRFHRVNGYRFLRTKECVAEIGPSTSGSWFWTYLPSDLVMGDPGARDACVHAIQACIPHLRLLPVAVDRILSSRLPASATLFAHAREREKVQDTFIYDMIITDRDGQVLEEWVGLRLQAVAGKTAGKIREAALLSPYLERRVQEMNPDWQGAIVVENRCEQEGRRQSDRALRRAMASPEGIFRSPNGKPRVAADRLQTSVAHCSDLLVAVAGPTLVSCDVEEVAERERQLWMDLLGSERAALAEWIAAQLGITFDAAATRVWTATECLLKAGSTPGAPLTFEKCSTDGTILLSSGSKQIVSLEASAPHGLRTFAFLSSM
jgi:enediyne polyketide synthase